MRISELWLPPEAQITGFCEYSDPNRLTGTPMNAWSNFYYVAVGFLIIIYSDLVKIGKFGRKDHFLFDEDKLFYWRIFALITMFVGFGSFFMHASGKANGFVSGHFFDILGMNIIASSAGIFSIAILFDMKKQKFYLLILVNIVLNFILLYSKLEFFKLINFGGGGIFELFGLISFVNELIVISGIYFRKFKDKGVRIVKRNIKLLFIAGIVFLIAGLLRELGVKDMPTCDPYSLWQWHAVWHFMTACAILIGWFYLLSEKKIYDPKS